MRRNCSKSEKCFVNRAANSVYLGNRVASQKKVSEPKTNKKGEKERSEKKRREGVRRKESGRNWKREVKKRSNQKSVRGQENGVHLILIQSMNI